MYMHRYYEAVQAYKQAANLEPDRADAYSALGIALLALERFEEAQRAFERARELDPNDADASKLIGEGGLLIDSGWISLQGESHPIDFRRVEIMVLE